MIPGVWWWSADPAPGWADYIGLLLTVVGFSIALIQLRRTKKAAEAAKTAADGVVAEAQSALSQRALMTLSSQIQLVVEDLDYAVSHGDVQVGRRALVRFGHLAAEAGELTKHRDQDGEGLADALSTTSRKATEAKGLLMSRAAPNIKVLVGAVALEISDLSNQLTAISTSLRNTVERPGHV